MKQTHQFTGKSVLIEQDGSKVVVTVLQDDKPPPPKEYTFSEAFSMMEQGKWMKPLPNGIKRLINGPDEYKGFLPWEIKAKWIES